MKLLKMQNVNLTYPQNTNLTLTVQTSKLKKYGKMITQVLKGYPENFSFESFTILKLFTHEIRNFPTV